MANTARAGNLGDVLDPLDAPRVVDVPGMPRGTIPFGQWTAGKPKPVVGFGSSPDGYFSPVSGARTAAGGFAGTPHVATARPGVLGEPATSGGEWYEKVHLLPRTKIEFGQIITLVQNDYEIYSALRNDDVTLSAVVNNALPGVDLPEVDDSLPIIIPPGTSILNSGTTGNIAGGGLGTLVETTIDALAEGLPVFDTNVDFTLSNSQTLQLLVAGSRIVLMPQEYENVRETLAFLTEIKTAVDGREQRLAKRKQPRQLFEITYVLTDEDRQLMQSLLMDFSASVFGLPLWHEVQKTTAAVSAGALQYQVKDTAEVDYRVGGLALVITDNNVFDVITIASLTSTIITAEDASLNAYAAGTHIMPLRTARVVGSVSGNREPNKIERFRIRFEVADNETGALTGDTSAYSTFNSRVLLDDCNVIDGKMPETYRRRVYRIDNQTGKVTQSTTWDRNKRSHEKGFVLRSRDEVISFRRLVLALRGRQTAFYIPTFIEDLSLDADLTSGLDTMDIKRIGYERFVQSREPKKTFRITFTDGTSLVREVQSAASVDTDTERLTLDTTWPANRTVAEVERIQWYELVRFDSDNIILEYPRIGLASAKIPVFQVFDDNA